MHWVCTINKKGFIVVAGGTETEALLLFVCIACVHCYVYMHCIRICALMNWPALVVMVIWLYSSYPAWPLWSWCWYPSIHCTCFFFRVYATPKSMFKQPHFYSFTLVSPFSSNFTSIHLPHASTLSSFCLPVLPLPPPTGLIFSLPLFSLCSSWFHYRLSPSF